MQKAYLFLCIFCSFYICDGYYDYDTADDPEDLLGNDNDVVDPMEDSSYEKRSVNEATKDNGETENVDGNREFESKFQNNRQQVAKRNLIYDDISKLSNLNSMSDDDIAMALSKLTVSELDALDKFIESEAAEMDNMIRKRDVSQRANLNNNDYDLSAELSRNNEDCNRCSNPQHRHHDYIRNSVDNIDGDDDQSGNQKIDKRRSLPFHRSGRAEKLTQEQRMEAKINFLRDKYKRQSELEKLENSIRNRQEKRETNALVQNPYYNSMIGPRARAKRENLVLQNQSAADNPESAEHIKLLEESFPNINANNDDANAPHIRVKRGNSSENF